MMNEWRRGEAGFYLERGEALEQAGRLDEAMSEFKRAVQADPGLAEAHMALGFHYRRKNLLSKAAEEFRTAVSLDPSYDSCFNLGHVLVDLGQPKEAIPYFQRSLAQAPNDPAVGYEIAYALYTAGEPAAALEQLHPLLASYPNDWELYYLTGSCELSLGSYADAQKHFERGLDLLPAGENDEGLQEALVASLRYQEYADPDPKDLKTRLYAEYGTVYLGAQNDDGLNVTVSRSDRLTLDDLAAQVQRFHALRIRYRWQFSAVVAVDKRSLPLATELAHGLRAPLVQPDEAPQGGLTLLVWAAVDVPELLNVVAEHVFGDYVTYVASMDQDALGQTVPDIVGVLGASPMAMPWTERDLVDDALTGIARLLAAAVRERPMDANIQAQVNYYARQHRRLRFVVRPDSIGA